MLKVVFLGEKNTAQSAHLGQNRVRKHRLMLVTGIWDEAKQNTAIFYTIFEVMFSE